MRKFMKLELLKLLKDFRLYSGAALLLPLLWYGFEVRQTAITKSTAAVDTSRVHEKRQYAKYITLLDSVSNKGKVLTEYYTDPRNPVFFSQQAPQFAHLPVKALAILAHGQSDLYNEEVLLSARFRDPRQQRQDMQNPALLKFGQFDAAMVLVLLFPIYIIALSFNSLSGEKEMGTLRLVAVQTGNLKKWLWAKAILYGLTCFTVAWIFCVVLLAAYGVNLVDEAASILLFSIALLVYTALWQLLTLCVNLYGRSSAFNALTLVSLWIVFAFILPGLSNLTANEIYKVPSRVSFINALRLADVEAEKLDSSQLINQYYFDHPELAEKKTSPGSNRFSANDYWKEIVMSQELVNKKVDPLYSEYNGKLKQANQFAGYAGFASPASIFNTALLQLAGVSSKDYFDFSDVAMNYRAAFLADIRDRILMDKEITYSEVMQRQKFSYQSPGNSRILTQLLALALYSVILFAWIRSRLKKVSGSL